MSFHKLTFLLILSIICIVIASQEPIPNKRESGQPAQEQTKNKGNQTKDNDTGAQEAKPSLSTINQEPSSLIGNTGANNYNTPQSNNGSLGENHPEPHIAFWGLSSNGWIAIFTLGLLISALLQFGAMCFQWCSMNKQEKWMKKTVRIAQQTAKASIVSAEAMEESIRPYLFVIIEKVDFTISDLANFSKKPQTNRYLDEAPMFRYRLENHGRGPAIYIGHRNVFRYYDNLPEKHPFESADIIIEPGTTFVMAGKEVINQGDPGSKMCVILDGDIPVFTIHPMTLASNYFHLPSEVCHLYVIGFVEYEDVAGKRHITKFCYGAMPHSDGSVFFECRGGKQYNSYT